MFLMIFTVMMIMIMMMLMTVMMMLLIVNGPKCIQKQKLGGK